MRARARAFNRGFRSGERRLRPRQTRPATELVERSLLCLDRSNWLRRLCISLTAHWLFDLASALLILAFCIAQAFYQPLEPEGSATNRAVTLTTLAVTALCTLELAIKAAAWGLLLKDEETLPSLCAALLADCKAWVLTAALGRLSPKEREKQEKVLAKMHWATLFKNKQRHAGRRIILEGSWLAGIAAEAAEEEAEAAVPDGPPPAVSTVLASPRVSQLAPRLQPLDEGEEAEEAPAAAGAPEPSPAAAASCHGSPGSSAATAAAAEAAATGAADRMGCRQPPPTPDAPHQALSIEDSALEVDMAGSAASGERTPSKNVEPPLPGLEARRGALSFSSCLPDGIPADCSPLEAVCVVPPEPQAAVRSYASAAAGKLAGWDSRVASGPAAVDEHGPLLRNGWGILDVVTVLCSWLSFLPGVGQGATAVRAIRLLLPLKGINIVPGLQACVQAILQSLPMLANVMVACLFVLWLFAIIGLQLFADALRHNCMALGPEGQPLPFAPEGDTNSSGYTPADNAGVMCTTTPNAVWPGRSCAASYSCEAVGTAPQLGQLSFDNIAAALFYDFNILSTMWWGMATSYIMEATVGWSFFYSLLLVLLGWFLLSLVLAALADKYMDAVEDLERDKQQLFRSLAFKKRPSLQAKAKEYWLECWRKLPGAAAQPSKQPGEEPDEPDDGPSWRWRAWLHAVAVHRAFAAAVMGAVLANSVLLAMPYYSMSEGYAQSLITGNTVLTWVFVGEAAVKITALGRRYFESPFHVVDLAVTVLCAVSVSLQSTAAVGAASLRALRALRLLRMFTVLPALQRFCRMLGRVLLKTAAFFVIVFVAIFIFAVLGMMLFGAAWTPNDPGAPRLNFNSFGAALVTVYDCLTGTLDISMFYAMNKTTGWAALYYVALTVVGAFLLLNLMITVLFELFRNEEKRMGKPEQPVHRESFTKKLRSLSDKVRGRCSMNFVPEGNPASPSHAAPAPQLSTMPPAGQRKLLGPHPTLERPSAAACVAATAAAGGGEASGPMPGSPLAPSKSGTLYVHAVSWQEAQTNSSGAATERKDSLSSNGKDSDASGAAQPGQAAAGTSKSWVRRLFSCDDSWKGAAAGGAKMETPGEFQHKALWLLPPTNPLRRALFSIVDDKRFEALVLLVILFNCGVMAVQNPGNSQRMADLTRAMELGCFGFYVAELLAKLLALGAWTDKRSYLRTPWNVLDCFIIASSVLATVFAGAQWASCGRLLRALRPLRLASQVPHIQAVIGCLFASITGVSHVLLVAALFQVIAATLSLQLFIGKTHYCTSSVCCTGDPVACAEVLGKQQCLGTSPEGAACQWVASVYNFDNLWSAITALSVSMTGSGWADAMFRAADTVGDDMQPQWSASAWGAAFFVVYQAIAQFFILNLFCSIILDKYVDLTENKGRGIMLTENQKKWVESNVYLLRMDVPSKKPIEPKHPLRKQLFKLVTHPLFQSGVFLLIILSGVLLSMQHYGMSDAWATAVYVGNAVFTVLFCLESLLMIAAYGGQYFRSPWLLFDGIVSWGSVPSLFLRGQAGSYGTLRSMRAIRILRAAKHLPGLRHIAATLYISLPTVANAVAVLAIFLFVFAVLGCQLFYGTMPYEPMGLTMFLNWQSVGNAFMLLCVAATGDAWDAFLGDTMVQAPACDAAAGQCGTPLASLFFLPFMLLCSFLLLGILLAVVYEAYNFTRDPPKVDPRQIDDFKSLWEALDLDDTRIISLSQFKDLLKLLDQPLGCRSDISFRERRPDVVNTFLDKLEGLEVDADGAVYYHNCLQALTARASGISLKELAEKSPDAKAALDEETRQRKHRQQEQQRLAQEAAEKQRQALEEAAEKRRQLERRSKLMQSKLMSPQAKLHRLSGDGDERGGVLARLTRMTVGPMRPAPTPTRAEMEAVAAEARHSLTRMSALPAHGSSPLP